jgi:CRP-like cAMP-binding protein
LIKKSKIFIFTIKKTMVLYKVALTKTEREELTAIISKGEPGSQQYRNASVLLNCDEGKYGNKISNEEIAQTLQINTQAVERVKQRFLEKGYPACIERKSYPDRKKIKTGGDFISQKPDCFTCHCKDCSILRNCSGKWLSVINHRKGFFQRKKGQALIREGMPLTDFYFIFHGKVKVVATGLYGKQQIKRLAKTGDILGLRGLGDDYIFHASVYALEDCRVCSVDKNLFIDILKANPDLLFEVVLLIARELRRSETRMKNLTLFNVREKVAEAILYINSVFGVTRTGELNIQLSRQEIAEIAMTTKEQISKVLSEFKYEGKIQTDGKKIAILNLPALQSMIGLS